MKIKKYNKEDFISKAIAIHGNKYDYSKIDKDNNIYTKLGFKFNSFVRPSYWYYKQSDGCIRLHKFGFRKQLLHKRYNLPLSMTENEMVKRLGYTKIWDCGLIKYVWKPYR